LLSVLSAIINEHSISISIRNGTIKIVNLNSLYILYNCIYRNFQSQSEVKICFNLRAIDDLRGWEARGWNNIGEEEATSSIKENLMSNGLIWNVKMVIDDSLTCTVKNAQFSIIHNIFIKIDFDRCKDRLLIQTIKNK